MTADRFDVFLCPEASGSVETGLRAAGLRVFRSTSFDDFDKIALELAASRVLLAGHSAGIFPDHVLTLVPGEPLPDLVRRVRERAAGGLGSSLLWTVHSELVARRAVLVRGLPGVGKTVLAEQYACLAGRFGGRVLRTGPFGHLDPDDFLPQFHLALAAAAGTVEDGFDRLRKRLAARIDAAGARVLVLVDDVPAGVPPGELARVLLPARAVRTLLTSRAAHWPGATVEVPGLTVSEGLRLLPSGAGFITRCDGHPMTLRAAAFLLRERGSSPAPSLDPAPHAIREVLLRPGRPGSSPEELPDTAPHAIREVLLRLGRPACELLRLGSVLAPAPVPAEVARCAVAGAEFEAAVEELVARGFAWRVAGGLRLQGLAVEVACGVFGEPAAGEAAEAVLSGLAGSSAGRPGAVRPAGASTLERGRAAGPAGASPRAGEPAPGRTSAAEQAKTPGPTGSAPLPPEPAPSRASAAEQAPTGSAQAQPNAAEPADASAPDRPTRAAEPAGRPSAVTHTYLIQHARVLAEHSPAHRVALLRPVAAAHETHGDPATAGEIHAAILSSGEATPADFGAAARAELACGLVSEALAHARQALAGGHQAAAPIAAQALYLAEAARDAP
ncbi:hypothetical protein ACIRSS_11620 [Amycolatopsis sp. NPDC101161]|uniref:hypothetical protein n=1 Tax=Amycolatopsis sp. NPDC101161 TaxID=3363940 RepID=UPI003800A5BA